MALRFRRPVGFFSAFLKHRSLANTDSTSVLRQTPMILSAARSNPNLHLLFPFRTSSRTFQSSTVFSSRRVNDNDDGKISPDTILFEGCDYNHWLITMDFPKDPKPTPEEMVETYVQTLAKVVGSVEEAKKRMYACSTTTYTGFQAVMTEEMSEKFRGLPGVVFILPDSYIDPVNKEYGGDKYINGTIIPRPPPIQYGRQGRYGDRNRNYDRPRYDRTRDPMPSQQGNASYDRQGSMQGDGRSYGQQQNYVPTGQQQNYGSMQGDGRGYGQQQNYGSMQGDGRNYGQQQSYVPTGQQQNYGSMQGDGRSYGQQQNYVPTGQQQQNYVRAGQDERGHFPPAGRDFNPNMGRDPRQGEGRDFGQAGGRDQYPRERREPMPMGMGVARESPPGGMPNFQGERRDQGPSYQRDFNQAEIGNSFRSAQANRDYASSDRRDFRGDYQNAGTSSVPDRQGMGSGSAYGQGYSGPNNRQGFTQYEPQNSMEGQPGNFSPSGQTGTDQAPR